MIFARNKKFADKTRADFWTNLSPGGVGKTVWVLRCFRWNPTVEACGVAVGDSAERRSVTGFGRTPTRRCPYEKRG